MKRHPARACALRARQSGTIRVEYGRSRESAEKAQFSSAAGERSILVAACELFAEKGFAHTSMADIVVATGMATGTLYRATSPARTTSFSPCTRTAAS
jgi:hypothetical protein